MNFQELKNENPALVCIIENKVLRISDSTTGFSLTYMLDNEHFTFEEILESNNVRIHSDAGYTSPHFAEILISPDFFAEAIPDLNIHFKIDNVKCSVSKPSAMFESILSDTASDKYWDRDTVISLKMMSKSELSLDEDLINALFWTYMVYNPKQIVEQYNPLSSSFPCISKFYGYYGVDEEKPLPWDFLDCFTEEKQQLKFHKSKYYEPISFYSSGKYSNDTNVAFLFFYKVCEYFFIYNKKDIIDKQIEEYRKRGNFFETTKKLKNILCAKEGILLQELISTFNNMFLNEIIHQAMINNLVDQEREDVFCEELYQHRNSIAHGKETFQDDTIVLSGHLNEDRDNIIWTEITEKIALYVLAKYCFGKDN